MGAVVCGGNRVRLLGLWALVAFAVSLCAARADAGEAASQVRTVGGVIDYAAILTPEQKRPLEVAAGQLARRIATDMFIVTVNDREAIWADQKSHYAMVERTFENVQKAIREHFNRDAPLTVLLVFKSSVVLHLKTSDEGLQEGLAFQNYYKKSAGALERIRRAGESYDAAAIRYLNAFSASYDEISARSSRAGLLGHTERVNQQLVSQSILELTQYVFDNPILDPLYKVTCKTITFLATHLPFPGWMSFLLVLALIYFGLQVAGYVLEKKFGGPGEFASNLLLMGGLALPLFMLFAVSMPDLENLLVIAQKYNDESGVLLTYLDWSSAIEEHSFAIPFAVIGTTAFVVGFLELAHRYYNFRKTLDSVRSRGGLHTSNQQQSGWHRLVAASQLPGSVLALGFEVLKAIGWILSQVIWPGPIAAYFMTVSVLRRLIDLWEDHREATASRSKQRSASAYRTIASGGTS